MSKIPARSEVDPNYTWNAESVFKNPEEWEFEANAILEAIPAVKALQGSLSEGPAALATALEAVEVLQVRAERIYMYAGFSYSVDTADQAAGTAHNGVQHA